MESVFSIRNGDFFTSIDTSFWKNCYFFHSSATEFGEHEWLINRVSFPMTAASITKPWLRRNPVKDPTGFLRISPTNSLIKVPRRISCSKNKPKPTLPAGLTSVLVYFLRPMDLFPQSLSLWCANEHSVFVTRFTHLDPQDPLQSHSRTRWRTNLTLRSEQ